MEAVGNVLRLVIEYCNVEEGTSAVFGLTLRKQLTPEEADSRLKSLTSETSRNVRRQLRNKDRRSWLPSYMKDGKIDGVPELSESAVSFLAVHALDGTQLIKPGG